MDEDDSEDEYRDEEGGKGADEEEEDDEEDEEEEEDEDEEDEDDYEEQKTKSKAKPQKRRKTDDDGMTEVIEVVSAPREKCEFQAGGSGCMARADAGEHTSVPKGRVSTHLVGFLKNLQDPAKNDRDWFARHKNVSAIPWPGKTSCLMTDVRQ